MRTADIGTSRLIAVILGLLGVIVLLDVLVIAVVQPDANYDGFRQVLFVIVGGLLVLGGAMTFAWPKRGSVEMRSDDDDTDPPRKEQPK